MHCVATSPPYWGLRDYGVPGQLGLERTPDEYIAKIVEGFRELRRVLRRDGTVWLNMGDTYSSGDRATYRSGASDNKGHLVQNEMPRPKTPDGIKPKDLIGMPWMVALALRADGWYLRQDIIWNKRNPMPESVGDRCTKAHEYIFLLTRNERYFFDQEAIKEPSSLFTHSRGKGMNPKCHKHGQHSRMRVDRDPRHTKGRVGRVKQNESFSSAISGDIVSHRNKRSVWTLATEAFKEAHFATFPTKLIEPCILAGTSEKGCCADCLAPMQRVMNKPFIGNWNPWPGSNGPLKVNAQKRERKGAKFYAKVDDETRVTTHWEPTCNCFRWPLFPRELQTIPCTVLDPFAGAGTTGVVAARLNRSFIGIELNPEYAAMAERRIVAGGTK